MNLEEIIPIPVPGYQCFINTQRIMALMNTGNIPGNAFVDQNYDGEGSDALWTTDGLTITQGQTKTFFKSNAAFRVVEPIESYFKFLAKKMGY